MNDWPDHPFRFTKAHFNEWLNQFPPVPADDPASDKRRGRAITNMTWALAADEALIIEFNNHRGLWMLTNMGAFMSSMDYLYRPVSFTPSRTKVDSDGKVRLILCHDDPGYHNWMDTQGLVSGNVTYRSLLSEEVAVFRTQLVKRSELAAALPPDTATVTPEERTAQMRARFDGIQLRYTL
jgi:hypothetical protein